VDTLEIQRRPLPYAASLQSRRLDDIELVVIHCTELPDLAAAREYGERVLYSDSGTGNSGHYYIERSGRVEQWVPLDRVAHHVRGRNERSIGIELVNMGRYPDWHHSGRQRMTEPYADKQILSLIRLIQLLRDELPGLSAVAGHEDLDRAQVAASDDAARLVYRKRDPGPLFPWNRLLEATGLERRSS